MIEEWLARRGEGGSDDSPEGYEKVLEVYALHILPRLEDWDGASEFLRYESELSSASKQARSLQPSDTRVSDTLPFRNCSRPLDQCTNSI